MNKKKLPKAVTRTADDMLEAATGGVREWHEAARRSIASEFATGTAADRDATHKIVDIAPKGEAFPGAGAAPVPAPISSEAGGMRRQWRAQTIVESHANYSAIGGIIPLPIVNVASVTTIIVRMVKMLCRLYGVPYERDRARAIVIGLAGGAMPTGLSAVTASTLFYLVPGSNLVGLAVSSVAASACTRHIGRIFIDHFERGATLADIPAIKMR
jgi:uncharacterized protein (DUF697 family)